jgi:hypothetical protein
MLDFSTPESQFISLLRLLRSDRQACLPPTLSAVDWHNLVELASRQDLAPLLYWKRVKNNPPPELPEELAQALKSSYFRSLKVNAVLYDGLEKLINEFNRAGIPVMLLKGAYLAEFIYPNIAVRPMIDLDLLVHRGDLQRALEIQRKLGYTGVDAQLNQDEISLIRHVPRTVNAEVNTELHWTLANAASGLNVDELALWQRAQSLMLNGIPTLTLSLEDLILNTCIHASYLHFFTGQARALLDLNEILRQKSSLVEWPRLLQQASAWNAERGVILMLYLAREYLGAPVPEEIHHVLSPDDLSPAIIQLVLHLFISPQAPVRPRFNQLVSSPNLWAKAQSLRQAFLPARAEVGRQYSIPSDSWRIWLYYPRMVFDRVLRHWATLGKIVRGDQSTNRQFSDTYAMQNWLNGHPPDD